MSQINATIALCAAAVIVLGLFSGALKRSHLSVPLLALLAGVAAGPEGLHWLRWEEWPRPHVILREAARLTLAVGVTGIALRTPDENFRRLAGPVALLLCFGMVAMWAVSTGLAWAVLGLPPLLAALLAATITPTDPVVASSIVTGRGAEEALPDRLRSVVSLESGANDGLGYMFVMIPLLALTQGIGAQTGAEWLREVLLVGIVGAVAIGAGLGALIGVTLRRADRAGIVESHSLLSLSVALSLLAVAGARFIGSDGILAAFAAGAAFNLCIERREQVEEENVQEAISKLFSLPVFVLLGAMLPWQGWAEMGWRGAAFAAAVLLLRRPLTLLAAGGALGGGLRRVDAVFLGWFAPVGIAAIYYALLARERSAEGVVWEAASLAVAVSVLVHGLTATPGMRLYRRFAWRQVRRSSPGERRARAHIG